MKKICLFKKHYIILQCKYIHHYMMLYDELSIYTNKNNFITNYIYMCRDNLYIILMVKIRPP